MLPPFIIEQIRKREEEERARHEQPRLELELPLERPAARKTDVPEDDAGRGIIILDLLGD
ncbi:MAG: hypothetical protein U0169_26110 [Polyangiaceae bacterium]